MVGVLRMEEKRRETQRLRRTALVCVSFGACALALFYALLQILIMRSALHDEREKLARIQEQYKRYNATALTVGKSDVELLDSLRNGRIFWTKKIAAMARHLPPNYRITRFGYVNGIYDVSGYGYISGRQEQLVAIDDYLNLLRADTTFSDVFTSIYLNSAARTDDQGRDRVSFAFTATDNTIAKGATRNEYR
jgi:hypothetical protein